MTLYTALAVVRESQQACLPSAKYTSDNPCRISIAFAKDRIQMETGHSTLYSQDRLPHDN